MRSCAVSLVADLLVFVQIADGVVAAILLVLSLAPLVVSSVIPAQAHMAIPGSVVPAPGSFVRKTRLAPAAAGSSTDVVTAVRGLVRNVCEPGDAIGAAGAGHPLLGGLRFAARTAPGPTAPTVAGHRAAGWLDEQQNRAGADRHHDSTGKSEHQHYSNALVMVSNGLRGKLA
jgi:hypothetical protein